MINESAKKSPLLDLTIVILSKDRNKFLKSTINFYSQFQIKTIAVHNCETPIPDAEIPINCIYVPGSLGISQRLSQAAGKINTKYVVMVSDDEYLIPSALSKIVTRLQGDESLSSCFGQTVALNKYKEKMIGNLAYQSLRTYSNKSDSIIERVNYHLHQNSGGVPIGGVYRVMKHEIFKQLVAFYDKTFDVISCKYIFEVVADLYLTVSGKSEYLDEIVWCRNWINPSISDVSVNRSLYYYKWWEKIEYLQEKNTYINQIFADTSKFITIAELNNILQDFYLSRKQIELHEENNQKSNKSLKSTIRKFKAKIQLIKNYWLTYYRKDVKVIIKNMRISKVSYDEHQLRLALLEFKNINF